jgi:TPR repeat protein
MLMLALAITHPVEAQSFKPDVNAGIRATAEGDYATALKHLRPLAKQGHVKAQFLLGLMYFTGHGVLQDFVMAYVWLNVAATKGFIGKLNGSSAKVWRDGAFHTISPSDHPLARKLSKLCFKTPAKCPEYSDD